MWIFKKDISKLSDEELLKKAFKRYGKKNYWEILCELRERPNQGLFQLCTEAILNGDEIQQIVGVEVLAQLGTPARPFIHETLQLYFRILETNPSGDLIASILNGLGHNNENLSPSQLQKICSFKDSKIAGVRTALAFSLLSLENEIAVQTLIQLSGDESSDVRSWACHGLGTQLDADNENIRKALTDRIQDADEDTRLEAIKGLAIRKDESIRPKLLNELEQTAYNTLLLDAILEFKDKTLLGPLQLHLKQCMDNPDIDEEWISSVEACIKELT